MIDALVRQVSPLFRVIPQETFVTSAHNGRTHSIPPLPLSLHRRRLSGRLHNPIKTDPTHRQTPYRPLLLRRLPRNVSPIARSPTAHSRSPPTPLFHLWRRIFEPRFAHRAFTNAQDNVGGKETVCVRVGGLFETIYQGFCVEESCEDGA